MTLSNPVPTLIKTKRRIPLQFVKAAKAKPLTIVIEYFSIVLKGKHSQALSVMPFSTWQRPKKATEKGGQSRGEAFKVLEVGPPFHLLRDDPKKQKIFLIR